MLPALLVVAPVTSRFAFARARLSRDGWEPAYRLSSGRLWWRCVRLAASRRELHPCAQRLAQHLSWQVEDGVVLTDVRALLAGYAAYRQLSVRTGWADWARLVEAGWLAPTRSPANQSHGHRQGPGTGRAARYVLTVPAALVDQVRSRSATSLVTSLSQEGFPSPSVPRPRRGWITLSTPTSAERRDASALLAGCQERWRRQRRDSELLTRQDWERLLPLAAQAQRQRPDVVLSDVLTDRVRTARHLASVLGWRLWQLLLTARPQENRLERPPGPGHPNDEDTTAHHRHLRVVRGLGGPGPDHSSDQDPPARHLQLVHASEEDTPDQYLQTVRALGGPAVVRAALATAQSHPARENGRPDNRWRGDAP